MTPALKTLTNQLARAALAPGSDSLLYLLQQARLIERWRANQPAAAAAPAVSRNGVRVGIWERTGGDPSAPFVRTTESRGEWSMWADVRRIEPKRARSRVVLIGESVARGWGYPPPYTPAGVLEGMLADLWGEAHAEVIDLSRVDLSFEVAELAIAAAALEPDAVVIFSGNNWRPRPPSMDDDLWELEAAVGRDGVVGLKRMYEKQLGAASERVVSEVCAYYRQRNVPVVWVVPESNLVDWQDGRVKPPGLGFEGDREWIACARSAQRALSDEDHAEAARLARRMMDLDGGTNGAGMRVLAACKRHWNENDEARQLLESARDALIWLSSHLTAPRPYSVVQEAIRRSARRFGCQLVDLPGVFARHTGGGLPDRRLFLDYCHLSAEGTRIAMADVAACIAQGMTGERVATQSLLQAAPRADDKASADAELLAAIHNAHWWQPEEVVRYHCARAASLSPHVAEMMTAYIDLQTSVAPTQLSHAAAHVASLEQHETRGYILTNSVQLLDPYLLQGIAAALDDGSGELQGRLIRRWQERNDLTDHAADLLSFYYLSGGSHAQELAWAIPEEVDPRRFTHVDFYRAYWNESTFFFVAKCEGKLRVALTLRVPDCGLSGATVSVGLNGHVVAVVEAGRRWRSTQVDLPSEFLCDGLNRLTVSWPIPADRPAGTRDDSVRRLARGENDALLDAFGELHCVRVSVRPPSADTVRGSDGTEPPQ